MIELSDKFKREFKRSMMLIGTLDGIDQGSYIQGKITSVLDWNKMIDLAEEPVKMLSEAKTSDAETAALLVAVLMEEFPEAVKGFTK